MKTAQYERSGKEDRNDGAVNNHGKQYVTKFELCLFALGIEYKRNDPGCPWQNGQVECQHRIDRERFYNNGFVMKSLEEGRKKLAEYNRLSNLYYRPCLAGRNSMEMLAILKTG